MRLKVLLRSHSQNQKLFVGVDTENKSASPKKPRHMLIVEGFGVFGEHPNRNHPAKPIVALHLDGANIQPLAAMLFWCGGSV